MFFEKFPPHLSVPAQSYLRLLRHCQIRQIVVALHAAKRFFDFLGEVGFAASYCIRNFYEFDFPLST